MDRLGPSAPRSSINFLKLVTLKSLVKKPSLGTLVATSTIAPNNVVASVTWPTFFNPLKFSPNFDRDVARPGKAAINESKSVKFKNFSNTLASGTAFATTAMARRETADNRIERLFIPVTVSEYILRAVASGIKLLAKESRSVILIFFSRSPSSGTD